MFEMNKDDLKNLAQSLLSCRAQANSVQSAVVAMKPLTKDEEALTLLADMATGSALILKATKELYEKIAPEAFAT